MTLSCPQIRLSLPSVDELWPIQLYLRKRVREFYYIRSSQFSRGRPTRKGPISSLCFLCCIVSNVLFSAINFPKVRLVACGSNEMFQLGIPGGESIETPRPCRGLGNVNLLGLVSGGGANAALLSSADGAKQLWTWGCNDSGALGRVAEDEDAQSIPAPIPELTGKDITHFSAGDSRILHLSSPTGVSHLRAFCFLDHLVLTCNQIWLL